MLRDERIFHSPCKIRAWAEKIQSVVENRGIRAIARENQGKHDEAVTDLEKAIELSPRDSKMFKELGSYYFRVKKYDSALKRHTKAHERDPRHPLHVDNIADCLKKQEKWEAAVEAYPLALKK